MTSPAVLIDPAPWAWPERVQAWLAQRPADALASRAALGLPTDSPLLLSGHQPGFWHAGVLAKRFALDAAAGAAGARAAWLVVDQDETDPLALRTPTLDPAGRLGEAVARFGPAPAAGAWAGGVPACAPVRASSANAPAAVQFALERVEAALLARADAPSLAAQAALAAEDLLAPLVAPAALVFASSLRRAPAFAALVERLLAEPLRAAETYNRAVRAAPEAGVAALKTDADDPEVPLWRTEPGRARRRLTARALRDAPPESLAPRALLMTLVCRLALCDLFIHGTGGGVYDRVTDAWAREWLGWALAPSVVVSATLRLRLPVADLPSVAEVDRAAWLAHRARHDPNALGLREDADRRDALLESVRAARAAGDDARPAYRALHAFLEDFRARHGERLSGLRGRADALRARRAEAALADDRTWAFPLHEAAALSGLRDAVRGAFAAERAPGLPPVRLTP